MTNILTAAATIGWACVYLLYRTTIPVYNLLDSLASNLDCLYLKCLQRESLFCSRSQMASARGIDVEELERDLDLAEDVSWYELFEGIFTALGFIVFTIGFGGLGAFRVCQQFHWLGL